MLKLFTGYRVHLCPEVKGRLTLNGSPLAGVKIVRSLNYEKDRRDTTRTDSDGYFHFPEKTIRSRVPARLFEVHNVQSIAARYEDQFYVLWTNHTADICPEPAVVEKLANLNGDLATPLRPQHFYNPRFPEFTHNIHSICRWTEEDKYTYPASVDPN